MITLTTENGRQMASRAELKLWNKNPRSISKSGYNRLLKQIEMGQHSPLLITADGTVIGGNMRLRAYTELGVDSIWVAVLTFTKDDNGLYAVLDGTPVLDKDGNPIRYFSTEEAGMMAYSLSHNDRAGFYDEDLVSSMVDEFDLDWNEFGIDFFEPKTINQYLEEKDADVVINEDYSVTIQCKDEVERDTIADKLTEMGFKVKK